MIDNEIIDQLNKQQKLIEKLCMWLQDEEHKAKSYVEFCTYAKILRKIDELKKEITNEQN